MRSAFGLFPQLDRAAKTIGVEAKLAELLAESPDDPVVRQS